MSTSLDAAAENEETSDGYHKSLGNRQVRMIAIGGAIGVGLFLGAGGRLASAGPSLVLSYAVCGIAGFFVMRALAELVLYRPTSSSFVAYAREFIGPWAGFVTGWMYWLNWAGAGIAEITAVGYYMHKWLPQLPTWCTALAALALLTSVNLLSVKLFGELEFWFSVVKVTAIVAFLVVGVALVVNGVHLGSGGNQASVGNLVDHGGFFPTGIGLTLMTFQAVIFAYAGIELVGVAAGEAKSARTMIPKAVNSVLWRIGVFYVGSVLLLAMLLPWSAYSKGESPFVTVFSQLGVPAAGDVMNLIVLTAALSSANSGLYSTGRMLRALADKGEAPAFAGRMSKRKVPFGAIAVTGVVYLLGVVLNYVVPQDAFDVATEIASLGTLTTWAMLVISQMGLRRAALAGLIERPSYRMPGAPVTNWLTLGFLALVLVMMAFSGGSSMIAVCSIPVICLVLWLGWRTVRARRPAPRISG
ncbi:amino acid permease [Kutzneria buriramensis]|uniref:L-asparagine permease n=1 Tax=Kutzneria buriramensis TaxID=1045776 RepID=A0A3E0G5N6_9PSEU|nr:amino acid permease [Kutzneria buriramensis]REH17898.1 L-asparagine permease [Kutzneria buriramensis]